MSLLDLLPAPKKVPLGRGDVEVVGLSLDALVAVFEAHRGDFERFLDLNQSLNLMEVVTTAPKLVSELLVLCTSSKYTSEELSKVPLHLQADILSACIEMTVPDPKKLQGLALAVMQALNGPPQKEVVKSPALPSSESLPS